MLFRGRQLLHRDLGYKVLDQVTQSMEDLAKVERPGKMTGKRLTLLLGPKGSG
jgi:translation initiation factor IF-3